MTEKKINQLVPGETAQGYYLVKEVECKSAVNQRKYLDLVLADQTGEIGAKLWDCSDNDESAYRKNRLVKVRGSVTLWQKRPQLKIEKIRPAGEEDGIKLEDFIPAAPEDPEHLFGELLEYINKIENPALNQIVSRIVADGREKLLVYPAALQNHHAIKTGLLYHVYKMLQAGERMCEVYPALNRDLLFAGIILHDIAKLEEMDADELGTSAVYTREGYLLGHIVQGIKLIERVAGELGLGGEPVILLQHMVLSHHYEPEFGSPRRPMFPEAEMLHYLDMIDARMYDMERVLQNTADGEFSEKIWVLHNRKLYKTTSNQYEEDRQYESTE
ncbi:MAG: HD domain-containing protein [Firmicutes bacterium]|nr:HD domain-containing protein [Bacillota bacterium]